MSDAESVLVLVGVGFVLASVGTMWASQKGGASRRTQLLTLTTQLLLGFALGIWFAVVFMGVVA